MTATFTELVDGYVRFQRAISLSLEEGESEEDVVLLGALAAAAGITIHPVSSA